MLGRMPADNLMDEGMRWFGPDEPVTLAELRQTGATAIFTSLHDIPYGEAWPEERIAQRRDEIATAGLHWRVVESLPVSEAIKTRTGDFRRHLENYRLSLERLGAAGIEVVVYNFMPVLDWVRTDLRHRLDDGTEALLYDPVKFAAFDLFALQRLGAENDFTPEQCAAAKTFWDSLRAKERRQLTQQTLDLFPGVKLGLTLDGLRERLASYARIDAAKLREHLRLFLEAVVPAAERAGVRLAIHPDDPPFSVLGLPRIVSTEHDLREILKLVDRPENGLCFCTGSLGVLDENDLPGMAHRLGSRIHAVHLRSVERHPDGVFLEANHLEGNVDMPAVVQALLAEQAARRHASRRDWRVAFRPDHGHTMLDDLGKPPPACPGYSLIGRLRGLAELRGLQLGLSRTLESEID
jgi:mannonate dehydratase